MQPQRSGSDMGGEGNELKRACDQCRTRKIRCDKESPCSNCRIAQRTCSSTGIGQKPKEPRQRVLISSQYEKKLDHFGQRLAGIESALRELTLSINKTGGGTGSPATTGAPSHSATTLDAINHASSSSSRQLTPSNPFDELDSDASSDAGDPAYEGTSSLIAHTVQASEFLEHAVEREQQTLSASMRSALSSLQQLVGLKQQKKRSARLGLRKDVRFSNQKPLPPGGWKDLEMPPTQIVVDLLREINDIPPVTFTLVLAFIPVEDFTDSCRKVYFATDDFSLATFIVVNLGLYYLFQEKYIVMKQNVSEASEFVAYSNMCRDNLETALANLPFFMPVRMESVEALLLGAGYAIEASKPSVAWQLTCAACQLCIAMGYHRLSPFPTTATSRSQPATPFDTDPVAEKKRGLFWFAYMLDKGLALRFGRSSILQDYDIALPRTLPTTINTIGGYQVPAPIADPWRSALELWITHAEVQGLIYERLYSASALNSSAESRTESARMLLDKQKGLVEQLAALQRRVAEPSAESASSVLGERGLNSPLALATLNMVLKSDEVSHCSSLALIYRAIPPSEPGRPSKFNDECIKAARAAFAAHEECMSLTSLSQFLTMAYMHWTILYAPFVPFIVLFCHIIATSDQEDLKRLEDFVAGLESARTVTRAIDKLYRLCKIMYDVARMYVEAKESERSTLDADMVPVENDFNVYLSQLGLMPTQPSGVNSGIGTGAMEGGDMTGASYQATQLGDWFEGNSYMMGLTEEDLEMLSQFPHEPGGWPS